MKRDLLFLLKLSSEMQHYLLQLTHIFTYIIQNALSQDCLLYLGCGDMSYRLTLYSLGVHLIGFT